MPGKPPLYKILFALIALTAIAFRFAEPVQAAGVNDGPIAILLSDSSEAYQQQATAFSGEIARPCQLFNLQGDIQHDPGLKNRLFASRPVLIYALGAKAAYSAKLWTKEHQEIPVIFAMVLNWQRYNLLEDNTNIVGIAAEIAPGTQFVNMTMFSPTVKRIGLLYSAYSTGLLKQARKEAAMLGLELIAEPIARSDDFQLGFKKLAGHIDAFWVLNDPIIYTLENMDWLEDRCLREKLLCVGQSKNLVKKGLTLAVNPDVNQIATQASAIAKNILTNHQNTREIQVMDPLGTQLLVNLKTAEHIGLKLSPQALSTATTVIDQ